MYQYFVVVNYSSERFSDSLNEKLSGGWEIDPTSPMMGVPSINGVLFVQRLRKRIT